MRRRAVPVVASAIALALAACGSDGGDGPTASASAHRASAAEERPAAAIAPHARLEVHGGDGGLPGWTPATLEEAVAGADVVARARVQAITEGVEIDGLPDGREGKLPPPQPGTDLVLTNIEVLSRAGWAHEIAATTRTLTVRTSGPAGPDGPGPKVGAEYVFFLAERVEPAVGGRAPKVPVRFYDVGWPGAFTPISQGTVRELPASAPGTAIVGAAGRPAAELAVAIERVHAGRRLGVATIADSPSRFLRLRPRVRRALGYADPQDTSDKQGAAG